MNRIANSVACQVMSVVRKANVWLLLPVVTCGLFLGSNAAGAETNYWVATTGTGQWHEASNWSLGAVPGAGDTVIITNPASAGNGYAVEIGQSPASVYRLTCSAPAGQTLTLNVRTNLTLANNSGSDSDWAFGPKGNVTVNIFSNGILDAGCQILGAGVSNNYNILRGGLLKYPTLAVNKRFRVYGALNIQGALIAATRAGELVDATALTVDGGYLYCLALSSVPTLLTNNPTLSFIGIGIAGTTVTMPEGVVTNRAGTLTIAGPAGGNASGKLRLSGGYWRQEGPTYVCQRPIGFLDILGTAQFISTTNIWVGSTVTGGTGYIAGYHGYVTVSGGQFTATNSNGNSTLFLGNITDGFLTCAGGTSVVDRVVLSNRDNLLSANATGKVVVAGGMLTVRQSLTATNNTASVILCATGTLNVANANVDGAGPLVIGDGKGSATLGLLAGTHRFADGLVITNKAVLAAGGVGAVASPAVTGNLALTEGAALHCDFNAGAGETLTLTGALMLPAQATVSLASLDGSLPNTVVLVAADSVSAPAGLGGWTVTPVGDVGYRVAVEGTSLVLKKKQKGTLISVF